MKTIAMIIFFVITTAIIVFTTHQPEADANSYIGQCIGACSSEQGMCMAACQGDPHCVNACMAAYNRCVARCHN